jgi:hypothetical protein
MMRWPIASAGSKSHWSDVQGTGRRLVNLFRAAALARTIQPIAKP